MKRKVAKAGGLRLSPNEEAQLLKEEHERRRKLRLQQVREQERNIALQIRQDVKQRRDEQLHHLAEELQAAWQRAQDEKIQALEKLYLSSLRAIGEGHRQAKENEPDLEALAKQAKERKQRAEKRHKEALKEQKNQKEKLLREQTWRTNARKHALDIEKERAAKIASLPAPPPHPFENIELKSVPTVKVCDADTFSVTHHHLFDPYVDREMDIEQPDARLLAEVEAKRKEGLQSNEERERREQQEKALLRGKHALKMVRLARDREKLMKELEQMQNMDLARRRQIVAQMPPQLFEPSYRRVEIKEEWQRELECAFEDMYTGDRKMKGDLILHLDPQPLPIFSDQPHDDELELSQEPDSVFEVPQRSGDEMKDSEAGSEAEKAPQLQSKLALKKLLNKIRNQKDHWTSRSEPETASEIGTIESGTISSRERRLCESESEHEPKCGSVSEAKELPEILGQSIVAGNAVLNHPQEQAAKIRKEAERQKQIEWIEHQKEQQLALLQQIEEQKIRLEVDFLKAQMQHQNQEAKKDQESQTENMNGTIPVVHWQEEVQHKPETAIGPQAGSSSKEEDHIQMIRDYQQRLLIQNRMHKESVEEARKHLHEYQNKLKERYQSVSAALLGPAKRLTQQNSIPEPSLQLQGFDGLLRVNLTADQTSRTVPVQEPTEHSELPWILEVPSEQKNKEPKLDVDSGVTVQPVCTWVDQRPFQLTRTSFSHQQTEKLGTPLPQSLEFHSIPESLMLKSQDTSVTTQPVAQTRHVQFTFPAGSSSVSSETLWSDKSMSHAPVAEKILLPPSLKPQHIPPKSWTRTTFDHTRVPPLHPLSSVPSSVASETGRTQECLALQNGSGHLSGYSDIVELRDRMLASSESIQAQQEHLKELQEQLDEQREALLSRQKTQEDVLLQKHAQLKQQMEQQQEALKEFLKRARQSSTCRDTTEEQETDNFNLLATLSKGAKDSNQEEAHFADLSSYAEKNILFQNVGSKEKIEPFQDTWGREQTWRLSKPPLSKVRLGLDLEQHELSIIPELDTPRSGRLSATGYRESLHGDVSLTSRADKPQSSRSPNEDLHEETDILRITADGKEESSGESQEQFNELWCEKSLVEAGGLCDSAHSSKLILRDQSMQSSADTGKKIATYPDLSFRPNNTVTLPTTLSPASLSPQTCTQQVACGYFSASTLSAASFITSCNPDRSYASTEPCSSREQHRNFSSPLKEKTNTAWDSSVSVLCKQDDPSEAPSSHLFGEMLYFNGNKIQQIIDKYTRDFSWSSLSNISSHDPLVELDTTDIERHFPNFHRELFQPLEPSPDSDTFSALSQCKISHNSKELSKSLNLSKNHELTASSLEERSNSLSILSTGKLSDILPMQQTGEEVKEQIQGAEELFEHLPLEYTLSDLQQSADKSETSSTGSEQNFEIKKSTGRNICVAPESIQCEELEGGEENTNFYSSIESFRSPSLSPAEDRGSFYQLIPDNDTVKSSLGTTETAKEDVSSKGENQSFVELPTASTDRNCETLAENLNWDVEIDLNQCTLQTVKDQYSLRTEMLLLSLPQEMNSKISISPVQNSVQQNCAPDVFQQPNLNAAQAEISGSCLSSKIPIWETHTGQGIMEEPELTLISSNDVSTAESDLEFFSQAKSRNGKTENLSYVDHSEVKTYPENRGFLPLNSEVDDSISTQADNPSTVQSTQEDYGQKPKQAGSTVAHLKKVEDLKVCSAEDRKTVEIQMHQRTSRLYNNLAEVKIRKEERERRENYAKNRERAKEFQKKTLEKLRARKATVKK
ncbi:centrosomal protein of 295 kDa isoform X2 [Rhineura floridana]|uniref:centrosomal protein of 295 kDa isoform X2 n=1 Tax=Rhineura floridana TaxID=261503 RepID=UPI002AC863CD|nr:centrosomal protein of 295 kDa isoform X2 [Rhineura floridana]